MKWRVYRLIESVITSDFADIGICVRLIWKSERDFTGHRCRWVTSEVTCIHVSYFLEHVRLCVRLIDSNERRFIGQS